MCFYTIQRSFNFVMMRCVCKTQMCWIKDQPHKIKVLFMIHAIVQPYWNADHESCSDIVRAALVVLPELFANDTRFSSSDATLRFSSVSRSFNSSSTRLRTK